jgi:hypothetical protein
MSHHQNAGQNRDINIANRSLENLSQFKYMGTKVTNQNLIQEEIKGRLNSGNVCYHAVQNLLSSCLMAENVIIRIFRTVNLPMVLYGCETWSLSLKKEHRLRGVWEQDAEKNICTEEGLNESRAKKTV